MAVTSGQAEVVQVMEKLLIEGGSAVDAIVGGAFTMFGILPILGGVAGAAYFM